VSKLHRVPSPCPPLPYKDEGEPFMPLLSLVGEEAGEGGDFDTALRW
jgi:hypothetical protein